MNPAALQRFNARKAALVRSLYPATVVFAAAPGRAFEVAFGLGRTEGQIQEQGGGVEYQRIGTMQFPVLGDFPLKLLMFFRITACPSAGLVGTGWKISVLAESAQEAAQQCTCARVET